MATVDRLAELFLIRLCEQAIVRIQGAVRLTDCSEPHTDVVLLRRRADFYRDEDAGPADVLLIVEVADTSLAHDRDVKVPLYARAGVPEVWLIDVNAASVTVYRDPSPEGYRQILTVQGTERLSPQAFPELALTPGQILGQ